MTTPVDWQYDPTPARPFKGRENLCLYSTVDHFFCDFSDFKLVIPVKGFPSPQRGGVRGEVI